MLAFDWAMLWRVRMRWSECVSREREREEKSMRTRSAIVTLITLLSLALPASAAVPKRIFVEHFGATW